MRPSHPGSNPAHKKKGTTEMRNRLLVLAVAAAAIAGSAAHAADLTPAEKKEVANIRGQIDVVDAQWAKNSANLQAQMDLMEAQWQRNTGNLQAQIDFIKNTAEQREQAWRKQCKVAFLEIGCPAKWWEGPNDWVAPQESNYFDRFDPPKKR
jgi:opacity protein-like surface antigen